MYHHFRPFFQNFQLLQFRFAGRSPPRMWLPVAAARWHLPPAGSLGIHRNAQWIPYEYDETLKNWCRCAGISTFIECMIPFIISFNESYWWFQSLWKIEKSVGRIIPNIWKNKQCFKPPTSQWIPYEYDETPKNWWNKLTGIMNWLLMKTLIHQNIGHIIKTSVETSKHHWMA